MQDYLNGLNEQQREAVLTTEGPLMIVAGAGSGKTKVLTTRIAHLMAKGVDAFNILALTFTNKAAAEMKERIEKILGNNEARNLYIGTFHSVFARILRAEAHRLGYPNSFTIYDSEDSKSVIKAVVKEMNLDEKHYKPNIVLGRISQAKNALVGPLEYKNDFQLQQEDMRSSRPAIAEIYKAYASRCFKNGAMDFDDLLLKMYELLNTFPEVLSRFQHKFKYILIDEYQDTNPVQYQITKLLAAANENICVVGDDAQSIYSFRGATIENILQFKNDYDDVKVVKLEQNYRSTKKILHVANTVININKGQIPKELWTDNLEGEKIRVVRSMTDNDEGKFVADTISEEELRNHFNHGDFAILYRTNAQSRAMEESLRRRGIPYRIFGGLSFYQRKEIKDFIAYLRVISNTRDEEALKRIINYPVRGIGKTSIEKALIVANEGNITFWEVLTKAAQYGFRAGALEAINKFVLMIQYFQSLLRDKNAHEVAVQVGKHTNIVKDLFNDKTTEGLARYENVQELLNSIKGWVDDQENLSQIDEDGILLDNVDNRNAQNAMSLGAYLQQITLLTDADKDEENDNVVKLMTIHAAKGLEFPVVFVVGVEESIFPSAMSINTREELEEERRLYYVAVTRAKSKLWITYANSRYKFGTVTQNDPSRFISEMPAEYVDNSYSGAGHFNVPQNNMGSAYERMNRTYTKKNDFSSDSTNYNKVNSGFTAPAKKSVLPTQAPKQYTPVQKVHQPTVNFAASSPALIESGQTVEHQKFGFGKVLSVDGASHNPIATIAFAANGEKKLMLNYAKLRIVEG